MGLRNSQCRTKERLWKTTTLLKCTLYSWIDAWNRHDVEAILSHDTDDQK